MTAATPRARGAELLLARISAAAGRARLGRRRATYPVTAHRPRARRGPFRAIRLLAHLAPGGGSTASRASPNARLDLYEHGATVALNGRIHVVRYDTTSMFRHRTRSRGSAPSGGSVRHTLTDVDFRYLVLRGGPDGGDPLPWEAELQRAVTRAQLPGALAALRRGERLSFGDVWLTGEQIGSGGRRTPWSRVQRIGVQEGVLVVTTGGAEHRCGPVSRIPNPFVFWALVERHRTDGAR
ncbi:DUF6585 family protein [Streptomyces lunalinharesii]|uniref:Uncharacterized protein n=1 Tax=Streptomyces lunalinharesii TaxID=333384 RepID=A0ABN3SYB5_9ACTN